MLRNTHNIEDSSPFLVFITGASGVGKTTVLKAVEQQLPSSLISVNYFDSIGVPPLEEMVRIHGSVEKWQEASTHSWINKLLKIKNKKLIFLEGQFNPLFASSYLKKLEFDQYLIFCLYADRQVRERRLIKLRKQPELVHEDMENWSNVLKDITRETGGIVIESSSSNAKSIAKKIGNAILDKISLDFSNDNGKYQLEIKSTIQNEYNKELRQSASLTFLIIKAFLCLISINKIHDAEKFLKLRHLWKKAAFFLRPVKDVVITPVKHFSFPAEFTEPVTQPIATLLYLHGGGYCLGSLETHRAFLTHLSHITNTRILSIDYRLAPESPFPAALEDVLEAYRGLRSQKQSSSIYICGDSAGGGLALALVLALKDQDAPLPEGVICFSPWTDLTLQGQTLITNQKSDLLLKPQPLASVAELYISAQNPSSPYLSPLYGDLEGLPPLFIQVAKEEILLSDSLRLYEKIKKVKGLVTLEIWRDRFHAWPYLASFLPEAKQALHHVKTFIEANEATLGRKSDIL